MIEKKDYTVNDDSTLLKFGNAFQSKIIVLLLIKKTFIGMYDILPFCWYFTKVVRLEQMNTYFPFFKDYMDQFRKKIQVRM